MKFREVVKILENNGFELTRTKGSHHIFRSGGKGPTIMVSVPYNKNEIPKGTLSAIIRQSGLDKNLFSTGK
ncbi:MAG: type II toxin-antitoxin system HicA family toxin [Rhodobacteraceae bacterium]|nr:type II toxin-antitoxin system HicA family toxin [Paracoccaceae bacterium]